MEIRQIAFVDAQGWMSISNQRDQCHSAAGEAYRELISHQWMLYTSNWAAYDALSHIRERAKNGGYEGAAALKAVLGSSRVAVFPVTPTIEQRAIEKFWSLKDKDWSITVCANLEIMKDAEVRYVLSGTRAYREAGLILLVKQSDSGDYVFFAPPW